MGVNSLPKTVTWQRRSCDLNPGPSAPESSTQLVVSGGRAGILSELVHAVSLYGSCAHNCEQFLNLYLITLRLVFVHFRKGLVCIFMCFCVTFNHFGLVLSKLVLLDLVFPVPNEDIGWKERLRNDLFLLSGM